MTTTHVVEDQGEVFAFLSQSSVYGVSERVVRIDTHGAVVFLAGPYAYKVKRAVQFPFMDYSTLERRRIACEAELSVNRPNAPGLYLDTVAIRRGPKGLMLGGAGKLVEWAVRMRRFDLAATLDRVAAAQGLSGLLIAKLTRAVLASHARAPRREAGPAIQALHRYISENDVAFRESPKLFYSDKIRQLCDRAQNVLAATNGLLLARGAAGFVRRCHGDLHLRNVVLIDGEPTLFDAIEFDETIATGDVLYDLAFLLMDIWTRELRESANLVLNRYLWESDEANLHGLAALPLFLSIRAAIRGKVIAAGLLHLQDSDRRRAELEAIRYFEGASAFLEARQPRIVAIGGMSGTGKSTLAAKIAPYLGREPGAVVVRSDIERKRLLDAAETERLPDEAYRPEVTRRVYGSILRKATIAAQAGYSVIADAAHLTETERRSIADLADGLNVPFTGFWLEAPTAVLLRRVARRRNDASDANTDLVRRQANYDIGAMNWKRLDMVPPLDQTMRSVRAMLGIG